MAVRPSSWHPIPIPIPIIMILCRMSCQVHTSKQSQALDLPDMIPLQCTSTSAYPGAVQGAAGAHSYIRGLGGLHASENLMSSNRGSSLRLIRVPAVASACTDVRLTRGARKLKQKYRRR